MDLPTLPTNPSPSPDNLDHSERLAGVNRLSNSDSDTASGDTHQVSEKNSAKPHPIEPDTLILAEVLTDNTIAWRIHNCKVSKKIITQALPLPFLYHYDRLDNTIKQTHPLTPELLARFDTPMTAKAAAELLGVDPQLLTDPWQVKVSGTLVVFSDALQLAVRLHWTNTGKQTQHVYTKNATEVLTASLKDWQFFGRVDVLYKNTKQPLISIDEQGTTEAPLLTIEAGTDYQPLLATHALTLIAKLEADKAELPWFETAILARLE